MLNVCCLTPFTLFTPPQMSGEHRAERFQTEQELGNMQMQLTQTEDRAVSEGRRMAEQELGDMQMHRGPGDEQQGGRMMDRGRSGMKRGVMQ